MPEGPEIRRMVNDISKAVGGSIVQRAFFAFDRFKDFESRLAGRRVTGVEARSKAVLVFFSASADDGAWCVYSHNQLYGKWQIGKPEVEPRTKRQLRFALIGPAKAARLYSASDIRLVRPDELDQIDYLARLGPDPLNQTVSVENLTTIFADRRFNRRALAGLLLDQGFVAGIGNYLRSEILFEAGIAPKTRPYDIDAQVRERLAQAILMLIDRTYRLKGITNDPERAKRLREAGWTYAQRRHMVFNRESEGCYACDTPIIKTSIASRRLYYCPTCQHVES